MLKKILFGCVFISGLVQSAWSFNAYSTSELDELEKEFVAYINQSNRVIRNPLANQYINALGSRLAQAAHMKTPHFFIVQSPEINAFAGPGGHIGINSQLIMATDTEDELAAVMAHEMAHVKLHHLYRMVEHEKQMRAPMLASILASLALGIINPSLGSGAMMATMTGLAQNGINFTRANEKESDRIGINILYHAGFDPQGMTNFFKKMLAASRYYDTSHIPAILRTHPLDAERIAEAQNRRFPEKPKTMSDNLAYRLFKEMIRQENTNNLKARLDYYQLSCARASSKPACNYGYALTLMKAHQYQKANVLLSELVENYPDSIVFQIALAQLDSVSNQHQKAIDTLRPFYHAYTDNYAVIMAYAGVLNNAGHYPEAVTVLLKGFRLYKNDLSICENLSLAEASAGQKAMAYLTLAQCELLQDKRIEAARHLKQVKQLAKQNAYLTARADALLILTKKSD